MIPARPKRIYARSQWYGTSYDVRFRSKTLQTTAMTAARISAQKSCTYLKVVAPLPFGSTVVVTPKTCTPVHLTTTAHAASHHLKSGSVFGMALNGNGKR